LWDLRPTDDRFGRQLLRGLRLSESAVHRGEKLLVIKRLGEKRNCARLHGVPFIVRTFAACYDYHTRLTTDRGEVCLHFQAGHSNHPNVEDYQLHTMHLDVSKESLCFVKAARRDSIRSQQISKGIKNQWIVVNQINDMALGGSLGSHAMSCT